MKEDTKKHIVLLKYIIAAVSKKPISYPMLLFSYSHYLVALIYFGKFCPLSPCILAKSICIFYMSLGPRALVAGQSDLEETWWGAEGSCD